MKQFDNVHVVLFSSKKSGFDDFVRRHGCHLQTIRFLAGKFFFPMKGRIFVEFGLVVAPYVFFASEQIKVVQESPFIMSDPNRYQCVAGDFSLICGQSIFQCSTAFSADRAAEDGGDRGQAWRHGLCSAP